MPNRRALRAKAADSSYRFQGCGESGVEVSPHDDILQSTNRQPSLGQFCLSQSPWRTLDFLRFPHPNRVIRLIRECRVEAGMKPSRFVLAEKFKIILQWEGRICVLSGDRSPILATRRLHFN